MPLMGAGSAAAAEAPAELYEGHLAEHTQPGRGEPLARGREFSDRYTTSQNLRFTVVEDEAALEQWRAAMPGYEVRGYTFDFEEEPHAVRNPRNTGPTGWRDGDVLHCRVRGVFDPRMVHVSVRRPGPENPSLVRVRAEGCGGTRVKAVTLLSREPHAARTGGAQATRTPMPETALHGEHTAHLPFTPDGEALDYAVEVLTEDGRVQRWPRPSAAWLRATPRG